jgi:hypothetical protein
MATTPRAFDSGRHDRTVILRPPAVSTLSSPGVYVSALAIGALLAFMYCGGRFLRFICHLRFDVGPDNGDVEHRIGRGDPPR